MLGNIPYSDEVPFPPLNSMHNAVGAWFLGPKAENHEYLKKNFDIIVSRVLQGRQAYYPTDGKFIDEDMASSAAFQSNIAKLEENLTLISELLGQHSVPFFSPRYIGHMNSDVTMPAVLGYLTTMLYNQNNVSPEASPFTSYIEYLVGQQLCSMLGFHIQEDVNNNEAFKNEPVGWGHITADGSIANLESIWVARNLKFYPLALSDAMAKDAPLEFVSPTFRVQLCDKTEKLLIECSTWELLNLTSTTIVELPTRLSTEYGMSTSYIESIMQRYIVQSIGIEALIKKHGIKEPQVCISATNHYSWPKSTAIAGIGRDNLIEVDIDKNARLDTDKLEELLQERLDDKQAVYAVIAIIGTTEHGTVDPLTKILKIRSRFREKGLSFLIHADCAWGGYFTSLLVEKPTWQMDSDPGNKYVPALGLLPYTQTQLEHLKYVDSITIDPHKSGYIPYPAGGLCYRDGRLRFQVTWNSPYINVSTDGVEAMGVYGVEGSKPGASAVATWLSHEVIGLHKGGYGTILGEALFTALKWYSHLATMSYDSDKLTVTTMKMLPAEEVDGSYDEIEAQRRYIYAKIVNRPNLELVNDEDAMKLVRIMGSDLMVNAFAFNFKIDGVLNKDISEANYLNKRIYNRLSISKATDNLNETPLCLMSSVFKQKKYGQCLHSFKRRIGLEGDDDLYILSSVCMSPFPTAGNFMNTLANTLREVAEEEVEHCYRRVQTIPSYHGFIIQGLDPVYLVYLPIFSVRNHRQQVILSAKLPRDVVERLAAKRRQDPSAILTLHTADEVLLADILVPGRSFKAVADIDLPVAHGTGHLVSDFHVSEIAVIKNRSIDPKHLDQKYPDQMPFYIYGTPSQAHIDHMLLMAPNVQLSASLSNLQLGVDEADLAGELKKGLILSLDARRESAMQPFNSNHQPSFFKSGGVFEVTVYRDSHNPNTSGPGLLTNLGKPFAKGSVTIGNSIWSDFDLLNQDRSWTDYNDLAIMASEVIASAGQGALDEPKLQRKLARIELEAKKRHYSAKFRHDLLAKLGSLHSSSASLSPPKIIPSRYLYTQPDQSGAIMDARRQWKEKFDEKLASRSH